MNLKQMNRISVVWGVLLGAIVVLLTIFGFLYKNKSSEYKKLEEELVNKAEKYVESKFLYPDDKSSVKITYEELKNEGVMDSLKKDDDECDGYVTLTYDGHVYKYKGYVKCSKYTTKGYE